MKKLHVILAVAATAGIAAPAAADVTGPRIEALVGYDSIDTGFSGIDDAEGVAFAVGVGYDFAVNPEFSFGVDAEVGDSTADLNVGPFKAEAKRDLYVGGRATYALSDSVNLYMKAGYTNLRVKASAFGVSDSDNADGFRGGVGAQYNLGGMYLGAEYRYSDYEADITRNQVMALVGMRF